MIVGHRKVKSGFFEQINKIIDWTPIRDIIDKACARGAASTGRPAFDSAVLFRVELLRTWYGLSDAEVEDQVNDRLSFCRFAGLSIEDDAPDSTTLCRFRSALVKAGIYDALLNEVVRQLDDRGIMVKSGAIVDASITDSPRRPRGRKQYEAVEDRKEEEGAKAAGNVALVEVQKPGVDSEARFVFKMNKLRFGFKRHTLTDANGLIRAEVTTPANESDIKNLEGPLRKAGLQEGTPVYADKGYDSAANRALIVSLGLVSLIMHKGARGRGITEREKRENAFISRIRYRVERTFGSMRRWFRGGVARYVGLAKTHGQHIMEAIAYNLYRSPGIAVSLCAK